MRIFGYEIIVRKADRLHISEYAALLDDRRAIIAAQVAIKNGYTADGVREKARISRANGDLKTAAWFDATADAMVKL